MPSPAAIARAGRAPQAPARTLLAGLLGAGLAVVLALVGATAASAHAQLDSSEPAAGSTLPTPPAAIVLRFDEPVELVLGAVRLYDADGQEVRVGAAEHPGGDRRQVRAPLPELGRGLYVVVYRVVSADGHPLQAGFTFAVGEAAGSQGQDLLARLLAGGGGDPVVGALAAGVRFASYGGLALLLGVLAFIAWPWPAGAAHPRSVGLVRWGWAVLAAATVLSLPLQGASASGRSLGAVLDPSLWREVLLTRSGTAWLVRLGGVMLLGVHAGLAVRHLARPGPRLVLAGGAVLLGVGTAIGGHGGTGPFPAVGIGATVVHVVAMAVWIGGLVALVAVALPAAPDSDLAVALRRFSTLAMGAAIAVVASGAANAWRQVGELAQLSSTAYGQLLVRKTVIVAVLLGVAALSRRAVQRWSSPPEGAPSPPALAVGAAVATDPALSSPRRELRRLAGIEVVLAAAVLASTTMLVNTVPARVDSSRPLSVSLVQGDAIADLTLTPARVGSGNELHLIVTTPSGSLTQVADPVVRLTLPERSLGPLDVPVERAGPNHYVGTGTQIPFAGSWILEIQATVDGRRVRFSTPVEVR